MKGYTLVYYVFQLEQTIEYNICRIKTDPAIPQLKVKHVIKAFPFNSLTGEYHFRFKSEFKQGSDNVVGWIDIINLNSRAPIYNGSIYVKILKLKSPSYNKTFTAEKLQKIRQPTPQKRSSTSVSPPPLIKQKNQHKKHHQSQTDLLDMDIKEAQSPIKKEELFNKSFLQDNIKTFIQEPKQQSGPEQKQFTEPQISKPRVFEDKTEDKIGRAREGWLSEATQQQEQRKAAIQFDQRINKWGYTMKSRNNFRTLLVTVHEIWPFGKWQAVDLGKLLTDNQLKKYYNKAMLTFHPDKNKNTTPRQVYLAKRIFSELNAAFDEEVK